MKKYVILLFLITNSVLINAQNKALSGVLDFLSTNPGTSKNLTDGQIVGARIISNFLNNQTQQAHEVNVARAGQTQVNVAYPNHQVISAPAEPEARLQREADGRVYLYYGNHEPRLIPEEYLLRAMGIDYETDYTADEMSELKGKIGNVSLTTLISQEEQLSAYGYVSYYDFASISDLVKVVERSYPYTVFYDYENGININKKRVKVPKNTWVISTSRHKRKEFNYLFACSWLDDLDGNGLAFDEVNGIKKTFKQGEKGQLVLGYCNPEQKMTLGLKLINYHTGQKLVERNIEVDVLSPGIVYWPLGAEQLPIGKYLFSVTMLGGSGATGAVTMKTTFKIISDENSDVKFSSNLLKTFPSLPSSEMKVVDIISGEKAARGIYFFEKIMGEYFYNLNKPEYDISKMNVTVKLNVMINDINKNVIWQSYTLAGELLGTTTKSIERSTFTGPTSNPTENFDFLDMVKKTGSGKYKIKAIVEATGEEFTRILTIE